MTREEQRHEIKPDGNVQRMLFIVTDALLLLTVCLCFLNLKLYSDLNADSKTIRERQVVNTERIAALEQWKNARHRQINAATKN